MEYGWYDVTFRRDPHSVYTKMEVFCCSEYEAIAKIKEQFPEAVIIEVKKRK